MGIRIFGAGLGLLAQVVASRFIGVEEYGHFAIVFVWLLLLGHLGTAGTSQLLYKLLAQYLETGQLVLAAGLLRFCMLMTLLASGLIAGLGIAAVLSGFLPLDPDFVPLAVVTLFAVPLLAFQDFLEAIARGLDRPTLGIGPAYLLRHLAIIAGLVGLLLVGQIATSLTVVALVIVGLVASMATQYALLRSHLRAAIGGTVPRYRSRDWLRTTMPLAAVDFAEVLYFNADVIILGLLVPPEQVAFYFAASRLTQILAYVPYGVSAATAQKYAALGAANRRNDLQTLISKSALLASVLAAIAALALSLLAGPLLELFGSGYEQARELVPVLCLGMVVACLLGPGEDVLNMLGEERLCAVAFVIALVANVAAAFVLIPVIGPVGAAIAVVLGFAVRGVMLSLFAYRRLGLVLPALGTLFAKSKGLQT
ncbi:lipopolysaccharide biosynthesis protein [Devosia sp. RR2S18]|uniref:lipopolysaccharide biosynthesis protein n=1 Tax=Devosia rhizosphaerae TaxID=3049774 RepID=UPI0025421369|nr:lipopolysaccharide biosynthesis protein [Devosia sp. RR2S18]WIJ23760.1 lipopolysaccharide biosynthesis protein [Devosia sp. RR2S18]